MRRNKKRPTARRQPTLLMSVVIRECSVKPLGRQAPEVFVPDTFDGFSRPHYTQVPDELFDHLLPHLSLVELRVLLYIIRRTFGFKKDADEISIPQMVDGITKTDGTRLDNGTGLSTGGVRKGLRGLLDKQIIVAIKNTDKDGASAPTTYALRFRAEGVHTREPSPFTPVNPGGSHLYTHNKTVNQDTEIFDSNSITSIENLVLDLARGFDDKADVRSLRSQARRLFQQSGLTAEDFAALVYAARVTTRQYQGKQGNGQINNKAAYFWATLRDLLSKP